MYLIDLRLLSGWSITNESRNKEARLVHDRDKTKNITGFFCFKVCSADLLSRPLKLGGAGHIVALDEFVVAIRKACSDGQACSTAMGVRRGRSRDEVRLFMFFIDTALALCLSIFLKVSGSWIAGLRLSEHFSRLTVWKCPHRRSKLRAAHLKLYVVFQPLRWCCVDCMIHHERDVREEQKYMYVARTSNNRVISSGDLCFCLLPRCEALRTCRSGFPIATVLLRVKIPFLKRVTAIDATISARTRNTEVLLLNSWSRQNYDDKVNLRKTEELIAVPPHLY